MAEHTHSKQTQTRLWWLVGLVLVMLVGFNFMFVSSTGWQRLGWNILGYALLYIVYRQAHLNLDDIGLSPAHYKKGLRYGGYVVLIMLVAVLVAFLVDKTAFHDPRYHHSLPTALYASLVLLPLKTIFFEELTFRGILPALLMKLNKSRRFATIASSVAFGLWHIDSAAKIGGHSFSNLTASGVLTIVGVAAFTTLAGLFFCELRWRSKSLLAPVTAHWFINGFSTILAALSWS